MKNQFFSMIAVAAFLFTIGGTVAAKSLEPEKRWFHVDPNTREITGPAMPSANCINGVPLCSLEYTVDSSGNPLEPTGAEAFGTPQN